MVTNARQRDAVFRALADPTRRQILGILRRHGQQPVGAIASHFRVSRPAISKHLRLLHAAGLVATRKQGSASLCTLQPAPLRLVEDWLHDYQAFWHQSLQGLKHYMENQP